MRVMVFLILIFFAHTVCAQEVTAFTARVKTTSGHKKGVLYTITQKYVCLTSEKDYISIPISSLIEIKIRAEKDGTVAKTLQGLGSGAQAGKDVVAGRHADYRTGYLSKDPSLGADAGNILANSVAGGLIGSIKSLHKAKKITFGKDSVKNHEALIDLAQYTLYLQLTARR